MSSEIIKCVAYDNYDDFQRFNFIFSQKIISLFQGLFNHETDIRVRYSNVSKCNIEILEKKTPKNKNVKLTSNYEC
jgi:hypothetical protein